MVSDIKIYNVYNAMKRNKIVIYKLKVPTLVC